MTIFSLSFSLCRNGYPIVSLVNCGGGSTNFIASGSSKTLRTATAPFYCLGTSDFSGPESQIWAKPLDLASKRLAVLAVNGAELTHNVSVEFRQLFGNGTTSAKVYDVWSRKDLGTLTGGVSKALDGHDSMFLIVTPQQ
jgi:hypothetical protein